MFDQKMDTLSQQKWEWSENFPREYAEVCWKLAFGVKAKKQGN